MYTLTRCQSAYLSSPISIINRSFHRSNISLSLSKKTVSSTTTIPFAFPSSPSRLSKPPFQQVPYTTRSKHSDAKWNCFLHFQQGSKIWRSSAYCLVPIAMIYAYTQYSSSSNTEPNLLPLEDDDIQLWARLKHYFSISKSVFLHIEDALFNTPNQITPSFFSHSLASSFSPSLSISSSSVLSSSSVPSLSTLSPSSSRDEDGGETVPNLVFDLQDDTENVFVSNPEVDQTSVLKDDLDELLKDNEEDLEDDPMPHIREVPYVIVGGGTAGYHAMKEILNQDPLAKVIIIAEEAHFPYERPPLSKELWLQSDREKRLQCRYQNWQNQESLLFYQTLEENINSPAQHVEILNNTVIDMHTGRHLVVLDDGTTIKYNKCLLAVGGSPNQSNIPLPQSATDQVTTFRTVDDFFKLNKLIEEGSIRHIAIVGSGFLGSELAAALAIHGQPLGLHVSLITKDQGILSKYIPAYLSNYFTTKLERMGVKIYNKTRVAMVKAKPSSSSHNAIQSTPLQLESSSNTDLDIVTSPPTIHSSQTMVIECEEGENIEADHVVLALGIKPNTRLAKLTQLELDPANGAIMVNAELLAQSDLYVAGDAASYYDPILGRRHIEHYDHAMFSGKLAGYNMAGHQRPYTYQPLFWSNFGDVGFEAVGTIDSSMDTVGVWLDNHPVKSQDPMAVTTNQMESPPISTDCEYERGIVYYLKNQMITGVLLVNLPGHIEAARRSIIFPREFDDLERVKTQIYLGEEEQVISIQDE